MKYVGESSLEAIIELLSEKGSKAEVLFDGPTNRLIVKGVEKDHKHVESFLLRLTRSR